jgi:hypothetical protein
LIFCSPPAGLGRDVAVLGFMVLLRYTYGNTVAEQAQAHSVQPGAWREGH